MRFWKIAFGTVAGLFLVLFATGARPGGNASPADAIGAAKLKASDFHSASFTVW